MRFPSASAVAGVDSRSAMVPGGLVPGLASLAEALIRAPHYRAEGERRRAQDARQQQRLDLADTLAQEDRQYRRNEDAADLARALEEQTYTRERQTRLDGDAQADRAFSRGRETAETGRRALQEVRLGGMVKSKDQADLAAALALQQDREADNDIAILNSETADPRLKEAANARIGRSLGLAPEAMAPAAAPAIPLTEEEGLAQATGFPDGEDTWYNPRDWFRNPPAAPVTAAATPVEQPGGAAVLPPSRAQRLLGDANQGALATAGVTENERAAMQAMRSGSGTLDVKPGSGWYKAGVQGLAKADEATREAELRAIHQRDPAYAVKLTQDLLAAGVR